MKLPGFCSQSAQRHTCGKRKGEGLALYVNTRWCNPGHVNIKISICCRNVELLAPSLHPYYLPNTLPAFTQYVDCNTRGNRTTDLLYANLKDAYSTTPLPALGKADHSLVLLHNKPRVRELPRTTHSLRKWSPEAEQAQRLLWRY